MGAEETPAPAASGGSTSAAAAAAKGAKSSRSSHKDHKDRRGESRRERASSGQAGQAKEKDGKDKEVDKGAEKDSDAAPPTGGSAATPAATPAPAGVASSTRRSGTAAGGSAATAADSKPAASPAAAEQKDKEKDKDKDKDKDKEKEKPRATSGGTAETQPSQRIGYRNGHPGVSVRSSGDGLTEEALTQIAQAKFEAQEDKLKDIARCAMSLLRDSSKLSVSDTAKRVAEVQKSLLKYEMQYIRAWEYQERRRKVEIARLGEQADRCRKEAMEEGDKIVELREVLESERRRRERYEAYEASAVEVNRKRTRDDCKAAISGTKEEIERLKRRRADHEALVEERSQRAQLLRHAVAELAADLRREREHAADVLRSSGGLAVGDSANGSEGRPASAGPAAGSPTGSAAAAELVEVIS